MQQASKRPLTIREHQAAKAAKREEQRKKVRIKNVSARQPLSIQLYGKNSKNASEQLCVSVPPGRYVDVPESRILPHQISTLKKRGYIRVSKISSGPKVNADSKKTKEAKQQKKSKSKSSTKYKSKKKQDDSNE